MKIGIIIYFHILISEAEVTEDHLTFGRAGYNLRRKPQVSGHILNLVVIGKSFKVSIFNWQKILFVVDKKIVLSKFVD